MNWQHRKTNLNSQPEACHDIKHDMRHGANKEQ